ncbi:hypothetical protein D3C84_917260 [compost metagenome]
MYLLYSGSTIWSAYEQFQHLNYNIKTSITLDFNHLFIYTAATIYACLDKLLKELIEYFEKKDI